MGDPRPAGAPAPGGGTADRARDHLANERTYLAWLRTAIGILAVGAAIARLGTDPGARDRVAVAVFCALGLLILAVGTRRYYQVSSDLEQGRFAVSRRTPLVLALAVVICGLIVLPLLL